MKREGGTTLLPFSEKVVGGRKWVSFDGPLMTDVIQRQHIGIELNYKICSVQLKRRAKDSDWIFRHIPAEFGPNSNVCHFWFKIYFQQISIRPFLDCFFARHLFLRITHFHDYSWRRRHSGKSGEKNGGAWMRRKDDFFLF